MLYGIILLIVAIPVGYLLAWLGKDELVDGRKWFRIIVLVFAIVGVWSYLMKEMVWAWTSAFIVIVGIVNYRLSGNKKFVN